MVFGPCTILPVHPDAMEDDGEANVKDEVNDGNNQVRSNDQFIPESCKTTLDDVEDEEEDNESVAKPQVCSKQFVVLNSYSMNFQTCEDDEDY